ATPFTATTVVVPPRVPPDGLAPSVRLTLPLQLVTGFPSASCAVTWAAGVIAEPAVVVPGCTVKTSCVAEIATRKSASDSRFEPKDTQGLDRPVCSQARPCPW